MKKLTKTMSSSLLALFLGSSFTACWGQQDDNNLYFTVYNELVGSNPTLQVDINPSCTVNITQMTGENPIPPSTTNFSFTTWLITGYSAGCTITFVTTPNNSSDSCNFKFTGIQSSYENNFTCSSDLKGQAESQEPSQGPGVVIEIGTNVNRK